MAKNCAQGHKHPLVTGRAADQGSAVNLRWRRPRRTNLGGSGGGGLPRQATQRRGVGDVVGLLQQRPADHLSLQGHKQRIGVSIITITIITLMAALVEKDNTDSPAPRCPTPPRSRRSWPTPGQEGSINYFNFLIILACLWK